MTPGLGARTRRMRGAISTATPASRSLTLVRSAGVRECNCSGGRRQGGPGCSVREPAWRGHRPGVAAADDLAGTAECGALIVETGLGNDVVARPPHRSHLDA